MPPWRITKDRPLEQNLSEVIVTFTETLTEVKSTLAATLPSSLSLGGDSGVRGQRGREIGGLSLKQHLELQHTLGSISATKQTLCLDALETSFLESLANKFLATKSATHNFYP